MQSRTQRVSLLCSRGLNISTRSSPFKLHAFCSSAAASAMELLQHAHPSSSYSRRPRDKCKHLLPSLALIPCVPASTEQASPFYLASGIIHFGYVQRRPYSRMKYFPLLPGKMRLFLSSLFCDFCKKNSSGAQFCFFLYKVTFITLKAI
jgi:hypothetical protein